MISQGLLLLGNIITKIKTIGLNERRGGKGYREANNLIFPWYFKGYLLSILAIKKGMLPLLYKILNFSFRMLIFMQNGKTFG